jgi:hypothetical protein
LQFQPIRESTFTRKTTEEPKSKLEEKKVKLETKTPTNVFNWTPSVASTSKNVFNTAQINYPSQLVDPAKKSDRQEESIKAIQNRVLELFVRERPDLSDTPLPSGFIFQRSHMIVGLFNTVLEILSNHCPTDFNSPILVSYLLTGLCDNLELFKSNWCDPGTTEAVIVSLILKYVQDVDQQNAYLIRLGPKSSL